MSNKRVPWIEDIKGGFFFWVLNPLWGRIWTPIICGDDQVFAVSTLFNPSRRTSGWFGWPYITSVAGSKPPELMKLKRPPTAKVEHGPNIYSMLIIPPLFNLKLQSDNLYWKVFVVVICVCWYQFEMFLSKSNWEASKSGECTHITRPFQRGKQMGHAGQSCLIHLMVVCCAHNNAAKMAFCKLNIQTFGPEQHSSFAPPNFFKVTTLTDLHPTLILLWKNPLTFHHTGCLIGILIIAHYPHITGQYFIPQKYPKHVFSFSLLSGLYYQTVTAVAKIGDSPCQLLCLIFSINNIPIGGHH